MKKQTPGPVCMKSPESRFVKQNASPAPLPHARVVKMLKIALHFALIFRSGMSPVLPTMQCKRRRKLETALKNFFVSFKESKFTSTVANVGAPMTPSYLRLSCLLFAISVDHDVS